MIIGFRVSTCLFQSTPFYRLRITDILGGAANISVLDEQFSSLVAKHAANEFEALPSQMRYAAQMGRCYLEGYHIISTGLPTCPAGPWRCRFSPLNGTKCALARRDLRSHRVRPGLYVHYSLTTADLVVSQNGCKMQ